MVALVIDDLGNLRHEGLRAIELPGPLTYAVLPHTPHGPNLARLAHALDKEVLVHLPMESVRARPLGAGGLDTGLARSEFDRRVNAALDSVPHAVGASNHMGSRLTAMGRPMRWLMDLLAARGNWLFLDSRTTPQTVAEFSARAAGLRTTRRDVFLDNDPSHDAIARQFRELIAVARQQGSAVAIGHPYPQTLEVLARELPRLEAQGIRLVPLSAVVAMRGQPPLRVAQSSSPGQAAITR